ncbi:MAG: FAD-binding protein [Acidimicrobiia bacterium]|nr:FAD-binding protein [Acidimicrobiia bacterium]
MTTATPPDAEPVWTNWSGKQSTATATLHHVRSEEDAAAVAGEARARGSTVRVAGSGHSHQPLVPNDGVVVDVSALSGVISVDTDAQQAWMWAGTPIYALGRPLHEAGLALINQGDIDRQLIGGAVATGTHGTGAELANLSAAVVGARIALASGELVDVTAEQHPELWQVVRQNLGAVGIVTRLALQLRSAYRLRERGSFETWAELAPTLERAVNEARHFEFFWFPTTDTAAVKFIDETDDEAEYPLATEGSRVGWNYEVLPNHRTWPHTELEYSVPLEAGPACLDAIRTLLRRDFPEMPWPVEYRSLAADDVWLSTAYERPTVTISLHQGVEVDDEPLFRAAEEVVRSFDGRPHWGKVNYLTGGDLEAIHPRWSDWWAVRDRYDPDQVFLNDYLLSIRPER